MKNKQIAFLFSLGILLFPLSTGVEGIADTIPFVEPDDGRAPMTAALDAAQRTIDLYVFRLTLLPEDGILNSIGAAVQDRGVTVRALLEPCPGEGASCDPPNPDARRACDMLKRRGVVVKWANPAFPKTHAKSILLDDRNVLIVTLNLDPRTFTVRRDYGVLTDDAAVVEDFGRVFRQDWQDDAPIADCALPPARRPDATVQDYLTLMITPDNGREHMLGTEETPGLIHLARASLKIQEERMDPQNGRGILPVILDKIKSGVDVQVLLKEGEADNEEAARRINEAGGTARFQPDLHAKMLIVDGHWVYVGSHNLTRDSLDRRREIGWVTTNTGTLARFGQTFDSDFRVASPTN